MSGEISFRGTLADLVFRSRTKDLRAGGFWHPRDYALIVTTEQWDEMRRTDDNLRHLTAATAEENPHALVPLYVFDVPVWIADSDKVPGPAIVPAGQIPVTARPAEV